MRLIYGCKETFANEEEVCEDYLHCCIKLLSAGADYDHLKNNEGLTAQELARYHQYDDVLFKPAILCLRSGIFGY